jgi:uncharacterized protein (DUF362 family)
MDKCALVKIETDIEGAMREALDLIGGFGDLASPFLVKPNICAGTDLTQCANTDVKLVETLIKLALEEKGDLSVKIIESNSMSKYAMKALEKFGYLDLEKRMKEQDLDVTCVDLSQPPFMEFDFEGLYFKNPKLHGILHEPGYVVSVALPKTHDLTMITGSLKNMFGLLPKKEQAYYHPEINEVIVDLNRLVKPDLCLIDARKGMEGVISGNTRELGGMILGRNPVSVDATMARLMSFNPKNIRHLVDAEEYNLGTLDPEVLGEELDSMAVPFNPPHNIKSSALIS